jgi:glyoxylase-like metal-dependent hydrolase (beta-lactamase superfamily II)
VLFNRRIALALLALGMLTGLMGPNSAHSQGRPATHSVRDKALHLYVYVADDRAYHVTSTLIYGRTESVLVDAQFLLTDASKLAERIAQTHTKLTAIFITHPDLDHWIGLAVLHEKFPDARIYMTKQALEEFKKSVGADLEGRRKRAPEETPSAVPTPEPLPSTQLTVDGQPVFIVPDQQGDVAAAPLNSFVFVPSLRAVIAGDIVFSETHLWLAGSTSNTRASWRTSLEIIKALQPKIVVAGHGPREPEDSTAAVVFTGGYLRDFETLLSSSAGEDQFVSAMQRKYPNLGQPRFVKIAAHSIFAKPTAAQNDAGSAVTMTQARQAIEQGNAAWSRARVNVDKDVFEKMLAPDFYAQFPDRRLTRQEFIQRISNPSPGVKLTRFDPPSAHHSAGRRHVGRAHLAKDRI